MQTISISGVVRTAVAITAGLALTASAAQAAEPHPGNVERSGSISASIAPLQPVTVDVPFDLCWDLGGGTGRYCTPDTATIPLSAFGGVLTLEWAGNSGAAVAAAVERCGLQDVQGARLKLSKGSGQVDVRATFVPTGASSPTHDSGWHRLQGRDINTDASVC